MEGKGDIAQEIERGKGEIRRARKYFVDDWPSKKEEYLLWRYKKAQEL